MLSSAGIVPTIRANAAVYISDTVIGKGFLGKLKVAFNALENVDESKKDWHPRSGNKVLDLIHPSLFPLVYGKTRLMSDQLVPMHDAIAFSGKGSIFPQPGKEKLTHDEQRSAFGMYSARFQWLPCEVRFGPQNNVKITSYTKNLHPDKHRELVEIIEVAISSVVPMWDLALTELFKWESEFTYGYCPPRILVKGLPKWKYEGSVRRQDDQDEDGSLD